MKAIDAYIEHAAEELKENTLNRNLCPYDVPWLAKRMPKQDCRNGCNACWNKEVKEDSHEDRNTE